MVLQVETWYTGIYNILKKRCLTTAKARLEWVGKVSGEITTQDERTRDKEKAKKNHVEANYAGQLIGHSLCWLLKRNRKNRSSSYR